MKNNFKEKYNQTEKSKKIDKLKLIKSHGKAPKQYDYYDEDWEEE